jgi:hypothetical protein
MILTRQSPTTIELTDRRRTMAAHSDELSVATEITAATTETKLLDSRKTEQVSGPKKTSPVWHFIHRLVNGPVTNNKGKRRIRLYTLCEKQDTMGIMPYFTVKLQSSKWIIPLKMPSPSCIQSVYGRAVGAKFC